MRKAYQIYIVNTIAPQRLDYRLNLNSRESVEYCIGRRSNSKYGVLSMNTSQDIFANGRIRQSQPLI
jgi:hypothetical protein